MQQATIMVYHKGTDIWIGSIKMALNTGVKLICRDKDSAVQYVVGDDITGSHELKLTCTWLTKQQNTLLRLVLWWLNKVKLINLYFKAV